MRLRRWVVGALVVALAAGSVSVALPADAAAGSRPTAAEKAAAKLPKPKRIHWHECADLDLADYGAQCGTLRVPLDWARPAGRTIGIAVSRVKHTVRKSRYQGVMIVNPGGPGESGLGLATLGEDVPNGVGDLYDWVGFDPRGVGHSTPKLTCVKTYPNGPRPQYVPTTRRLQRVWLARSKRYANACARRQPALLRHMTTRDVAKDVDYLRRALGRRQINYYGFSYGTYLGAVYATLFPHHLRRAVFDSTVDPRGIWYQANLKQDIPFQRNEEIWFGWLARYDSYYHLGATRPEVEATFNRIKTQLHKHPAGGVVGSDEWVDIFLNAGYYQLVWLELGDAFSSWVHHHDVAALKDVYNEYVGPNDDNGFAVYNAVQCTDAKSPARFARWRRDSWRTYARAPFETWANTWYNGPCLFWKAPSHKPVRINGKKAKSVLMIDETLDAATPYPGSLQVRSLFPGARLIKEPGGTTHADSLFGDACVDTKIAAYLARGVLPRRVSGRRADASCAPLPVPNPLSNDRVPAAHGGREPATLLRQRGLLPVAG